VESQNRKEDGEEAIFEEIMSEISFLKLKKVYQSLDIKRSTK